MACDAINVLTGIDPAREFRGTYHDGIGALTAVRAFLKNNGIAPIADELDRLHLGQLAEVIARREGFAEIHPLKAQRGDCVLFDQPNMDYLTLGIVTMDGWHLAIPESQLSFNLRHGLRAWRIA